MPGTLAAHIGLAKAMRRFDLRRTISFHGRVRRAREFAFDLPRVVAWMPSDQAPAGTLWAEHVSGDMPTGTRTVRLDRLRHLGTGERGLLSNARCLSEGVDVPTLDGVAFIDPKGSQTDIVQAVGRAIRKAPDKTLGTIVLPVFIEGADDPEQALEASAFKPVWAVLRALRDQDEVLAEQLDSIRRGWGRQGIGSAPHDLPKVVIDVPVGVDFVRALQAKLVERATSNWEFMFGLLERFVEREGHARVPVGQVEAGYHLGGWVDHQRQRKDRDTIDAKQVQRLQSLPGWSWDPFTEQWDWAYEHLVAFARREGHARVPIKHREAGLRLGHWVFKQRQAHQKGLMEEERAQRLEAVPGWVWDPHAASWENGYQALVRFSQREGHCRVMTGHREQRFRLGQWINVQRTTYKTGKISRERIPRLEGLAGWTWEARDDRWEGVFTMLEEFVAREGHARVPQKAMVDGFGLGRWVTQQRTLYRRGALPKGRASRLAALPRWEWTPTHSPISRRRGGNR